MVHRLKRHLRELSPWSGGRFFAPGEMRLALLGLLAERPGHGYELMTRLEARCGGAYRASPGTIYPTLQQLEDEGLCTVAATDGKKVHAITDAGRAELDAHRDAAAAIWRRADAWSEWGVMQHPDAAEILGPALRLAKSALKAVVKSHGDPAVIDAIRRILEDARLRIEAARRER
ncbi:MAG: PadR family transcriptional regulator [Nannocystaceae bacterium]